MRARIPTREEVRSLLTGPRHETYLVELLDENENLVRVVTDNGTNYRAKYEIDAWGAGLQVSKAF